MIYISLQKLRIDFEPASCNHTEPFLSDSGPIIVFLYVICSFSFEKEEVPTAFQSDAKYLTNPQFINIPWS